MKLFLTLFNLIVLYNLLLQVTRMGDGIHKLDSYFDRIHKADRCFNPLQLKPHPKGNRWIKELRHVAPWILKKFGIPEHWKKFIRICNTCRIKIYRTEPVKLWTRPKKRVTHHVQPRCGLKVNVDDDYSTNIDSYGNGELAAITGLNETLISIGGSQSQMITVKMETECDGEQETSDELQMGNIKQEEYDFCPSPEMVTVAKLETKSESEQEPSDELQMDNIKREEEYDFCASPEMFYSDNLKEEINSGDDTSPHANLYERHVGEIHPEERNESKGLSDEHREPSAKVQWKNLQNCLRRAISKENKRNREKTCTSNQDVFTRHTSSSFDGTQSESVHPEDVDITYELQDGFEVNQIEFPTTQSVEQKTGMSGLVTETLEILKQQSKKRTLDEHDKEEKEKHDALYQFFTSMYKTTKKMPVLLQLQVKQNIFTAVMQAEEEVMSYQQQE